MRDIIVIIPFFNFMAQKRLVDNHLRHIELLNKQSVETLTVELAHVDGDFTLPDCGNMMRLRTNSVMWHKEALINLGASSCRHKYISWQDSGCLLSNGWCDATMMGLLKVDAIQCFSFAFWLDEDGTVELADSGIVKSHTSKKGGSAFGGAWAAKRDFFDKVGLYQYDVVGGGDVSFSAITGEDVAATAKRDMSPEQAAHYDTWLKSAMKMGLRVGHIECGLTHLWHGPHTNRKYSDRHMILKGENFDPAVDIRVDGGVMEWNSDKPGMHKKVREFFEVRAK